MDSETKSILIMFGILTVVLEITVNILMHKCKPFREFTNILFYDCNPEFALTRITTFVLTANKSETLQLKQMLECGISASAIASYIHNNSDSKI